MRLLKIFFVCALVLLSYGAELEAIRNSLAGQLEADKKDYCLKALIRVIDSKCDHNMTFAQLKIMAVELSNCYLQSLGRYNELFVCNENDECPPDPEEKSDAPKRTRKICSAILTETSKAALSLSVNALPKFAHSVITRAITEAEAKDSNWVIQLVEKGLSLIGSSTETQGHFRWLLKQFTMDVMSFHGTVAALVFFTTKYVARGARVPLFGAIIFNLFLEVCGGTFIKEMNFLHYIIGKEPLQRFGKLKRIFLVLGCMLAFIYGYLKPKAVSGRTPGKKNEETKGDQEVPEGWLDSIGDIVGDWKKSKNTKAKKKKGSGRRAK